MTSKKAAKSKKRIKDYKKKKNILNDWNKLVKGMRKNGMPLEMLSGCKVKFPISKK